jgi:hypothetical protein
MFGLRPLPSVHHPLCDEADGDDDDDAADILYFDNQEKPERTNSANIVTIYNADY